MNLRFDTDTSLRMAPGSRPTRKLSGLDPDCLMNILMFLDVESLLRFQEAFPQLLTVSKSPSVWLAQLSRDWNLPLQASIASVSSMPLSRLLFA